jgi:hypothetical protein
MSLRRDLWRPKSWLHLTCVGPSSFGGFNVAYSSTAVTKMITFVFVHPVA